MAVFMVEAVEVVVYRGSVDAETEDDARVAGVADLMAHNGHGQVTFVEVADRTASIVAD